MLDWLKDNIFTVEGITATSTLIAALASAVATFFARSAALTAKTEVEERDLPQILMMLTTEQYNDDHRLCLEIWNFGGVATDVKFGPVTRTPETKHQSSEALNKIDQYLRTPLELAVPLDVFPPDLHERVILSNPKFPQEGESFDNPLAPFLEDKSVPTVAYQSKVRYYHRGKQYTTTCTFRLASAILAMVDARG